MARLPYVGGDPSNWGTILNDFLNVSHDDQGNLRASAVASSLPASTAGARGSVRLANDLSGTADNPVVAAVNGVSLSSTAPTANQVLTAVNGTSAEWRTPTGGGGGAVSSVSGRTGDITLTKTDVGLGSVDNTTDLNKPVSSATQTALNAKLDITAAASTYATSAALGAKLDSSAAASTYAPKASPTFTGTVTVPYPSGNTDAATKSYVDGVVATGGTPDANASTLGKVQLAGDLAGSATSPSVAKIKGVTLPASAPTNGQVLTATSATATAWQTPAGGGGSGFPAWNIVQRAGGSGTYNASNQDWVIVDNVSAGIDIILPAPSPNATVLVRATAALGNGVSIRVAGPNGVGAGPYPDPNELSVFIMGPARTAAQFLSDGTNWWSITTVS